MSRWSKGVAALITTSDLLLDHVGRELNEFDEAILAG